MIQEILVKFGGLKIAVIGDMMLDAYQWGKVQRISPEAPVPVIEIERESFRLGGGANAALNIKKLGAEVIAVGLVGNDANGMLFRQLLKEEGIAEHLIFTDNSRKTTIKTRIGAVNQQIVRIDIEDRHYLDSALEDKIIAALETALKGCDFIIIEDYNKGLLSPSLIQRLLALSDEYQIPVGVDPKQHNFFLYEGVSIFKPNYQELQNNLGLKFESEEEFHAEAFKLKERMQIKQLVVTRGAKGIFVFGEGAVHHSPAVAKEVFDVSGAGDTVISVLSLALAAKADIVLAARLANIAAGVVCGKMGTASVSIQEILEYQSD